MDPNNKSASVTATAYPNSWLFPKSEPWSRRHPTVGKNGGKPKASLSGNWPADLNPPGHEPKFAGGGFSQERIWFMK